MKITTLFFLILLICTSCASTKIEPSQWQSKAFKAHNFNRLLVYASTDDKALQVRFEEKLAKLFSEQGIVPLKMNELFPEIEYQENHSQEEINEFVIRCKEKNIDKVLLASQKSIEIDTVRAKTLHNYMNSLEPLKMTSGSKNEEELQYDEKEIITYTIEAAVYDIAKSSEDKPIASTTLKATNPKSYNVLENKLLKAIKKLFKSR
ncbi:hypothetical protein [Winogradskyella bathintestinalis]|uniref:DUF4136 domain-containing protein n=1 Tax=Winogradskyella bathintestinalis TaxID=3035208 RepID=A0ABT7ZXQ0_9FLAO|nr:hypothetical protein [Winogradskyella bathintestinalis]MDN3493787.1 hypothetical protein [Winogradskyella bathintestinalis]